MKFWIVERRQEVLTGDGMTVERIRELIAEYDTLQAAAEVAKPDPIVVVLTDTITVTPATVVINPAAQVSKTVDTDADTPPAERASPHPDPPPSVRAPATCEHCGQEFLRPQALASHRRSKHPDVELTAGERAERAAPRMPTPRDPPAQPPPGRGLGVGFAAGHTGVAGELQAAPLNEPCAGCGEKFRLRDEAVPVEVRDARGGWVDERFYHDGCWPPAPKNLPGPKKVPDLAANHVRSKPWKRSSDRAGGGR